MLSKSAAIPGRPNPIKTIQARVFLENKERDILVRDSACREFVTLFRARIHVTFFLGLVSKS